MKISELAPKKVFTFFEHLSSVPHGSGNTTQIADLCEKFAVERNLRYSRDKLNNVVIFKSGTAGYENSKPVIIQGHLDMVCAKDKDCSKNMAKEPIDLCTDGKYLWADKTSLGGDDLIAVAIALAILDSDDIPHPPLECVFTVDEETGMDGAAGLDFSLLSGRTMLNLDSESDGVLTVGCAGGLRLNFSMTGSREKVKKEDIRKKIVISGLKGGHSGAEIDRGRASANQLMARLLFGLFKKMGPDNFGVCSVSGGEFDNVITNFAEADITVSEKKAKKLSSEIKAFASAVAEEYKFTDPDIKIVLTGSDSKGDVLTAECAAKVLSSLFMLPQGVQGMSHEMEGLVETSCNLGVVRITGKTLHFSVSVRSSVESKKRELSDKIIEMASVNGFRCRETGDYPGWKYAPVSPLRDLLSANYTKLTGKTAKIEAIHAGLESGFFSTRLPGLDCVSFGPDLYDIHTSRERLDVKSTERLFNLVCETLKDLK